MAKKIPKNILALILLLTFLVIAGASAYIFLPKAKKEESKVPTPTKNPRETLETTRISWLLEKMGEEEETGAPLMRVRVDFKGKTNQGYDVGTYTGKCFEIAKSKWEFLENEISGVICGWSDWGDEVGLFKEGDKFIIKHGLLGSGSPATEGEPAIPFFRGDFKTLLEIKVEGWLPYEFYKTTDYGFKKPFILFYPPFARIVKSSEFSSSDYSPSPPDKLLFEINNNKCWMIILPPAFGIEVAPPDFSSEEKDIDIDGKKWGTLIWKAQDKVTLHDFINKEEENYTFSVNPETLSQCLNTYKQILSTFEFIEPLGELSPTQPEQTRSNLLVEEAAKEVVGLLKEKNLAKLSTFIHPTKGVRLSPYTYVNVEKDLVFTQDQIKTLSRDSTKYHFGVYDGSGLPIDLSFNEYYEKFVYDKEFALAKQVSVNEPIGQGNTIINILEVYPWATYVEHYISGSNEMAGMDWSSLRLVFEQTNGKWYLVGIVHDQWTI